MRTVSSRSAGPPAAGSRPAATVGRICGYLLGAAFVAYGARGLVGDAIDTRPVAWAAWVLAVAVAHDAVWLPLVLIVGWCVSRIPAPYRRPAQAALIISATLAAVTVPLLSGAGRRPDNPSQLPLDYGRGLAWVLAAVWLIAAIAAAASWWLAWRRGRPGPGEERDAVRPPAPSRGDHLSLGGDARDS